MIIMDMDMLMAISELPLDGHTIMLNKQIEQREKFRWCFFNIYRNEVTNFAYNVLRPQLEEFFNELMQSPPVNDLEILYKHRSTIKALKVCIKKESGYMVYAQSVDESITKDNILYFSCVNPPSLENLKKRLKASIPSGGRNFKVVDSGINDEVLVKILRLAKYAKSKTDQLRERLNSEFFDTLQARFEAETNLKFADIYDMYLDYSPEKFKNYLDAAGFAKVPGIELFPRRTAAEFGDISAYPFNGWEISRKDDGYGHECGSSLNIDWINKRITGSSWSSDD